jgi:hypothetical protein
MPGLKLKMLEQALSIASHTKAFMSMQGDYPDYDATLDHDERLWLLKHVGIDELLLMAIVCLPTAELRCVAADSVELVTECCEYMLAHVV